MTFAVNLSVKPKILKIKSSQVWTAYVFAPRQKPFPCKLSEEFSLHFATP